MQWTRIQGGSALIEADDRLLYDFQGAEMQEILDQPELDPRIFAADKAHVWSIEDRTAAPLRVEEAFGSLLGPHTPAVGHWLCEYLPKYVAASGLGSLPNVPVLIDAGMPATHREALELVLAGGTEIVEVPEGRPVSVSRLWCASTLGYWPLLHRPEGKVDGIAVAPGRFRPVLAEMRKRAARWYSGDDGPARVFLARKPHLRRQLVNAADIEAIAEAAGFVVVYPEEVDFKEQVRLVRNARYVVAPDGSALHLTLFSPPGTKLCILSHPFPLLWTAYSSMVEEIDMTIFTGDVVNANDTPGYPNFGYEHHADYRIDLGRFGSFLDTWAR
jgi:hypothetical protein